jgi:NADP-dependent aldehyde dehydrogenase
MTLTGKQFIKTECRAAGTNTFSAYNPGADDAPLPGIFYEATKEEVETACMAAGQAFQAYSEIPGEERAVFLEAIAQEIMSIGDELLERANAETGLALPRLQGERGRTINQLSLFAKQIREGSWVNAIIDTAEPERQPMPKPDIRQMQVALGPVAVFGASNFPFAYSTAGGDTASALAAGCPVVFKGHPAHPGTCELVAMAIGAAVKKCNMPAGVFNMVQGASHDVATWLVQHPAIKAVGFTGSLRGGKALFDLAVRREEPIPVYAEMGSVNPVFFLPGIVKERGEVLAKSFAASVTLGTGQFCTNPGAFVVVNGEESKGFIEETKISLQTTLVGSMLTSGIRTNYLKGVEDLRQHKDVVAHTLRAENIPTPQLFTTTVAVALAEQQLMEEVFGPSTIGVIASSKEEVLSFAAQLKGHLTATVHGTAEELMEYVELINILKQKAGRLIVNGFPTGVEVTHAMVHGGPFPATADGRSTSVGPEAIYRFTRPVCFQDFPSFLLPRELRDENPMHIRRKINGEMKDAASKFPG